MNGVYTLIVFFFYIILTAINDKLYFSSLKKREIFFKETSEKFNKEHLLKRKVELSVGKFGAFLKIKFLFLGKGVD